MDRTRNGFAYRCLPLNIANAHGWLLLNTIPFIAQWDGGSELDAVTMTAGSGAILASSHFGFGVLTFHVNALFRTEPGDDLMVTGPLNEPKDGIQPLTGVVETDWGRPPRVWRSGAPEVAVDLPGQASRSMPARSAPAVGGFQWPGPACVLEPVALARILKGF